LLAQAGELINLSFQAPLNLINCLTDDDCGFALWAVLGETVKSAIDLLLCLKAI
jgi:hypothetical protein